MQECTPIHRELQYSQEARKGKRVGESEKSGGGEAMLAAIGAAQRRALRASFVMSRLMPRPTRRNKTGPSTDPPGDLGGPFYIRRLRGWVRVRFQDSGGVHRTPETGDDRRNLVVVYGRG
jgi:hypothetical protein